MPISRAIQFLDRVPNYHSAPSIAQVDASELSEREFSAEFVEHMRPCLIRGAIRHWPAVKLWPSPDYLRQRVGNREVSICLAPRIEHPAAAKGNPELRQRMDNASRPMRFEGFLEHLISGERGHCVLHAASLRDGEPLAPLARDVGGFPFLHAPRPARFYPNHRVFIYRDSYTDWHIHQLDETLMCQVKGSKEVLLLPPDTESFRTMKKMAEQLGYLADVDWEKFPELKTLKPFRVTVGGGDALYIPTCWWHAVEPIEMDWGITLSWCWGSPLHLFDPRLAGIRNLVKRVTSSGLNGRALFTLSAISYSLLHRFVTGQLRKRPYL